MSKEPIIGLLGASSLVGGCLISLLKGDGRRVFAFSRTLPKCNDERGVTWLQLTDSLIANPEVPEIKEWVCVAPVWVLPQYFPMLEACGASRIVVLSSTSRFTKTDSSDEFENDIAARLINGEERLKSWAMGKGVEWVILRPTLIYGYGQDKNIAEIARFIRRFGFFPLFGNATGLRQPIYVEDVAMACIAALKSSVAVNRAYNISGGETLTYREMVSRVFAAMHFRLRLVVVPLMIFRMAVACLRVLPRYRHWSVAMAERMNRDQVFDHSEATKDFGFSPRPFCLAREDLSL